MVNHAVIAALAVTGCAQSGLTEGAEPAELDRAHFRCSVQPVIAARCSFLDCHGSAERPYRVFAVQRMRLEVTWDEQESPLTELELAANYDMSRGFAGRDGEPALLSAKPLDAAAGGLFHDGKARYGGEDVFATEDDPGYEILEGWLAGSSASADCAPIEEVGP